MSFNQDYDVAIVGAGPVGMTLALLLARRGKSVAIYERWMGPYPLPRAVRLDPGCLRTYQTAGVLNAVQKHLDQIDQEATTKFFTPDGEVLIEAPFATTSESGFPGLMYFNQPDIEGELDSACLDHPLIAMERGWEAVELKQDRDCATLTLDPVDGEDKRDGESITIKAKFIVGCDGANSFIRSKMDVDIHDTGFSSTWLVIDIKPDTKTYAGFSHSIFQTLEAERPTTMVPSGPGRRRFEIILKEGETPEDMVEPDRIWEHLARWDVTPENCELVRTAIYTFRGRWARNWRDGRVLLAGDAAHQAPPFLGQGLNSGIRDTGTLAWLLDLTLQGITSLDFLDNYTNERLPHVETIANQAVEIGKLICITDPQAAEERDKQLRILRDKGQSPSLNPPPWRLGGPGIWQTQCEHAGHLGVQALVKHKGQTTLLDNITGGGWHLLGNDVNPLTYLSDALQKQWDKLAGHAIAIGPGTEFEDTDGRYATWFKELGACAVLVRPDFYIFSVAKSHNDIEGLVNELIKALKYSDVGGPAVIAAN